MVTDPTPVTPGLGWLRTTIDEAASAVGAPPSLQRLGENLSHGPVAVRAEGDIVDRLRAGAHRSKALSTRLLCSRAADELDAARAEIERLRAEREWRDIASAPRDSWGPNVLISGWLVPGKTKYVEESYWVGLTVGGYWSSHKTTPPTHWQPLPPPPTQDETP